MVNQFRPVRTGSDADLAFAVVVLASYFSTFSALKSATTFQLLMLIGMGVAYITIGIYGYSYAARSGKVSLHILYFLIQLSVGGGIIYLGRGNGYNAMVLLPLAGHSVVLLARNLRVVVNLAIVVTYALTLDISAANWGQAWSGLPLFLAGQIFILVFTQMAVSEEKARSDVEKLVRELESANRNLREYAAKAEELATIKERNRLAREIHDGLGHYLTTIFMHIQAARAVMKADPSKAQESMSTAQNMTQEALADVRRSVAALRDLPEDGMALQNEIEKMLQVCQSAGIKTEFGLIGTPRKLSPPVVSTIYRAVQEAINNTCKHSNANQLGIKMDFVNPSYIRLLISDDGVGAGQLNGGFGLIGMRERIHMLNGELSIVTSPGSGFNLEVCIPG